MLSIGPESLQEDSGFWGLTLKVWYSSWLQVEIPLLLE